MQHLLDNPGLVTALVTLILAVAGYIGVKTEQAKQGERIVGLQRQADAPPPASVGPTPATAPQPQAPQLATTVLTLPANGTAVHIEAVRPMVQPAMAPVPPVDVPVAPAEAPVGPSVGVTDDAGPAAP